MGGKETSAERYLWLSWLISIRIGKLVNWLQVCKEKRDEDQKNQETEYLLSDLSKTIRSFFFLISFPSLDLGESISFTLERDSTDFHVRPYVRTILRRQQTPCKNVSTTRPTSVPFPEDAWDTLFRDYDHTGGPSLSSVSFGSSMLLLGLSPCYVCLSQPGQQHQQTFDGSKCQEFSLRKWPLLSSYYTLSKTLLFHLQVVYLSLSLSRVLTRLMLNWQEVSAKSRLTISLSFALFCRLRVSRAEIKAKWVEKERSEMLEVVFAASKYLSDDS